MRTNVAKECRCRAGSFLGSDAGTEDEGSENSLSSALSSDVDDNEDEGSGSESEEGDGAANVLPAEAKSRKLDKARCTHACHKKQSECQESTWIQTRAVVPRQHVIAPPHSIKGLQYPRMIVSAQLQMPYYGHRRAEH